MQLKGEQSPVFGVTRYLVFVANKQQCALFVVFASRNYIVTRRFVMNPCVVRVRQFECFGQKRQRFWLKILKKYLKNHLLEADLPNRRASCNSIIQASNLFWISSLIELI